MRCENCGNESPEGSRFCIKCGKEFKEPAQEPATCPHCGAEVASGTIFCPACGKSIVAPAGEIGGGPAFEPLPPLSDPQAGTFTSNIALDIVLTFITCGIYYFFWQARQIRAINHLLGQEKYNFWLWFLLTLVTCGLFNIYYEYYMAQGLIEAQEKHGRPKSKELPVLSLLLTIFGLSFVADAIQQNEINKFFGK
ncbi:MAG: DUF4234 domain-containing protein [Syntrophorhabdaceae bacterium]